MAGSPCIPVDCRHCQQSAPQDGICPRHAHSGLRRLKQAGGAARHFRQVSKSI
jgi:hypothetical protein